MTTSRPSTRARPPIALWLSISSRRRSNRSASAPATGASSSIGANCRPVVMPTATAELVGQDGQDEPVLGDPLHPGAGVRHDRADGPEPVVGDAQRAEGGAHGWRSSSGCRRRRPGRLARRAAGRPAAGPARRPGGAGSPSPRRAPASVRATSTWRRSSGWPVRVTRPRSTRAATVRVIDGGCTCSCSASSPGVIGPCRSSAASTENGGVGEVGVGPLGPDPALASGEHDP